MTPDVNDPKEHESAMPRHAKRPRNDLEDNDDGLLQRGDLGTFETKPLFSYSETFPEKLMKIIDDDHSLTSIRWSSDGTVFGIHPTEFEAEVMSKHFRSSKLASFIRRLSRWGFERAVGDEFPVEWIVYRHPLFRRGQASLLKHLTTGHMDEVNAIKEEAVNNTSGSDGAPHPPSLTWNHLIALGSEAQVVSRARGQTPPGHRIEDHMMPKDQRIPARFTVNNDGPIVGLLRSQGMQQALASNPSLPAQHPMLGGISQNSFDDMLLRNLSFDQLMQMNSQLENRRLLSLLQSQSLSDASNLSFLPMQPTPWLHANLFANFEMNQQQQNQQLSDQGLYRYLLYRQNRG